MSDHRRLFFWVVAIWALPVCAQTQPDAWVDKSPHKDLFVTVNGVKLEYLDWGGSGQTIVFLAGLGNTAHIFDNIAPQFTDHFHVLALTRRGFGRSDKPAAGYDIDALVEDLRQFLNAVNVDRVILVGHSFAAAELNGFAQHYPQRVEKLVYFDNAYNYTQPGTKELLERIDGLTPRPSDADRASLDGLLKWNRAHRPGWNDACEADLRERYAPNGGPLEGVEAALVESFLAAPADYSKFNVPILAFFADHRMDKLLADAGDADRANAQQAVTEGKAWWRNQIDQFRREAPNARVVELPDTEHFCFIQRQDEVVRQMKSFLESN